MLLAKIVGTVVATRKDPGLLGTKLLVLQPGQLIVIFEIVFLEIHSVLPWGNLWVRAKNGHYSGQSSLECRPALAPLLSHSPEVVKHSAVFFPWPCKGRPI